jgi:hypothetical protein
MFRHLFEVHKWKLQIQLANTKIILIFIAYKAISDLCQNDLYQSPLKQVS